MARRFALRFNPALQSRALVVFSCLSKIADEVTIKQLLALIVQVSLFGVWILQIIDLSVSVCEATRGCEFDQRCGHGFDSIAAVASSRKLLRLKQGLTYGLPF